MNLIQLFESKPFQDVGTFNSIFYTTPILGFSSNLEVEICGITAKGRRILIGEDEIFLDISTDGKIKQSKQRTRGKPKFTKKKLEQLPSIYKELKPSEFMIYCALKELGEAQDLTALSRMLSIGKRTIGNVVKTMLEKNVIEYEKTSGNVSTIRLKE